MNLKLNSFALKLHFIPPEHSTLCVLTHSVLSVQFLFSDTDLALLPIGTFGKI